MVRKRDGGVDGVVLEILDMGDGDAVCFLPGHHENAGANEFA